MSWRAFAYNGVSPGWGWKNFKGSTTCKNNTVSYNRFNNIMKRLHDSGIRPDRRSAVHHMGLAILGMGVSSFAAQLLFTQGYKNTSVQLGTLLSLTTPVIASFLGWYFLDEPLGMKYAIGAVMTLAACTLMATREAQARQAASSDTDSSSMVGEY
jgi:hypothetical protein